MIKILKQGLKTNYFLLPVYVAIYNFFAPKRLDKLRLVLDVFYKQRKRAFFVQIGSNNGKSGDPLYNLIRLNTWHGILIEPVPYLFEQLKATYQSVKQILYFENVAIAGVNGNTVFYSLKPSNNPNLPEWYNQLGSFDKNVILKHKVVMPEIEELIIEEKVHIATVESLTRKYNLCHIDLLHIDAEGYDFEILKSINFQAIQISTVLFEHRHLVKADFESCILMMKKNGFAVYTFEHDSFCIRPGLNGLERCLQLLNISPQ